MLRPGPLSRRIPHVPRHHRHHAPRHRGAATHDRPRHRHPLHLRHSAEARESFDGGPLPLPFTGTEGSFHLASIAFSHLMSPPTHLVLTVSFSPHFRSHSALSIATARRSMPFFACTSPPSGCSLHPFRPGVAQQSVSSPLTRGWQCSVHLISCKQM